MNLYSLWMIVYRNVYQLDSIVFISLTPLLRSKCSTQQSAVLCAMTLCRKWVIRNFGTSCNGHDIMHNNIIIISSFKYLLLKAVFPEGRFPGYFAPNPRIFRWLSLMPNFEACFDSVRNNPKKGVNHPLGITLYNLLILLFLSVIPQVFSFTFF